MTDYSRYGWKCSEENLKTLPESAPKEAHDLTKWLTLEGRRSSLEEWLGAFDVNTERIHGKFWHIGAWTQRMSHSSPNFANIPAIYDGTPKTGVELIKAKYDAKLRSLFQSDGFLVGCDAEGIQLRILCHYMKSAAYRDAIVSGDKALGTDIHSVNKRALGSICKSRDDAKTFIYAWLLGAGIAKVASILGCSMSEAKTAINNFLDALPELKRVKTIDIPRDVSRGYFIGLDGRKVKCSSAHLMLAGYLQNGEAVMMKHATVGDNGWYWKALASGIPFRLVNLVHDEWQVEVLSSKEDADRIGQMMCDSLEDVYKQFDLFCPLSGSYKVGRNWEDTH